jgi:hypothetical protein
MMEKSTLSQLSPFAVRVRAAGYLVAAVAMITSILIGPALWLALVPSAFLFGWTQIGSL